jgi:dTDP-4-amino-4,6-dideoxygalactose transaminase
MKEKVKAELQQLTNHKYVEITDRGNSAIFVAFALAQKLNPKTKILIPEQGGWISYRKYPKFFNFEMVEIKTNRGVIDLKDLEIKSKNACAFIFTSFAGYYAEQPLKEISVICKTNNCIVIEDATGSIGDKELCNGKYSDIIVGSFGNWKPVYLGYGGWISSNQNIYLAKEALSTIKVHSKTYEELYQKLEKLDLNKYLELQKKVKEELKNYTIFHKEKRGLNVITEYNEEILQYCKDHNYDYVICPKEIRVNEKAISIELKRLIL